MRWGLRAAVRTTFERAMEIGAPEVVLIAYHAMRRHKKRLGSYPNLIRPRTFNEKVLYRMLFDRRPLLKTLQDKYAAREYVRERLGDQVLPRLHWVTQSPADIPFDKLPARFVVKATHGSGFYRLVSNKSAVDWNELVDTCAAWLVRNYYYTFHEWAYKAISPRIMVEELLSDGTGPEPMDYKFYVFAGRVHLISAEAGRTTNLRQDYYGRSWTKLDLTTGYEPIGGVPRPKHFDEMVHCAETLGSGLDFVRVDLYDAERPYFGELTLYPNGGAKIFVPRHWDRYLGDLWDFSSGARATRG
jgi:hypothetical protein